jgi:thymidylate kinase
MKPHKFTLLSFSGIDGAGKSSQIEALLSELEDCGHRFERYTFWDDVVAFSRYREHLSLRWFRGERGVGRPDRPIARRDKNVTSWYMVLVRLFLYALDSFHLSAVLGRAGKDCDFVVFDRYIYDELANLPLACRPVRAYVRLLVRITPKPDVAFLLDARPEDAVSRKPEYPLEFVHRNRDACLSMAKIAGMSVLPPASIAETTQSIRAALATLNRRAESEALSGPHALPASRAKTPGG